MRALTTVLFLSALSAAPAFATLIFPGDFSGAAVTESFEGLTDTANSPLTPGTGYFSPGKLSPYTFLSGVTLSAPIPNPGQGNGGAVVGDFSVNVGASFSLLGNGVVTSALSGTSYFGLDSASGSATFSFAAPVNKVGAYVDGAGDITVSVFDSSNQLLETAVVTAVSVANWGTNFIGFQDAGISKITFSGSFGVLDNLIFEADAAVPEPSSALLFSTALAGLALLARKRNS